MEQPEVSQTDQVNRPVWSGGDVARSFGVEGFSDEGERQLFLRTVSVVRGSRVLDMGYGGGRTTTLLRLLTDDYIGLDYTPEMVAVARERHPGMDLRLGDARDLSDFAATSFDVVMFSFNAIDALDHRDRGVCLSEIARVLRPGGSLMFSTFNIVGPDSGVVPWAVPVLPWQVGSLAPSEAANPLRRFIKRGMATTAHAPDRLRGFANWRRLSKQVIAGSGWALGPMPAHDFGLLVHFVALDYAVAELAAIGLDVVIVVAAEDGRDVTVDDDLSGVRYFQIRAVRR